MTERLIPGPRKDTLGILAGTFNTFLDPQHSAKLAEKYGSVYAEATLLGESVVVTDPELARHVLSHPDLFTTTPLFTHDVAILLASREDLLTTYDDHPHRVGRGSNLLTNPEGEKWEVQRAHAREVLSGKNINAAVPDLIDIVNTQVDSWNDGTQINVEEELAQITSKTMSLLLFGDANEMTSEEFDKIHAGFKGALNFLRLRILLGSRQLPEDHRLLIATRQYQSFVRNATNIAETIDTIANRQSFETNTFISGGLAKGLTMPEIKSQMSALIQAGFETTQTTLHWMWIYLSGHPEWYKAIHKEVSSTFPDGQITTEGLVGLEKTSAFINEVLRVRPPVGGVARYTTKETELGGYVIPKDTIVIVNIAALHTSSQLWSDANEFNPHRWIKKKKGVDDFNAHMPFANTRGNHKSCVGMNLAMLEAKVVMAQMMLRGVKIDTSTRKSDAMYTISGGAVNKPKHKHGRVSLS